MPLYHYRASTLQGEIVEGVLNAVDERSVVESLKDTRLIPIKISQARAKKSVSIFRRSSVSDLLLFTTEIAALLGAGLPLDRSLHILSEISESPSMKEVLASVLKSIREGSSFSDAMMKESKVFPRLYVNVVRAGELGGVLESVMNELNTFLEASKELKESIYSALIYPVILAIAGTVSVAVLLTYVIPKFSQIFEDIGQAMPIPTQILMAISNWLSAYWWIIILMTGLGFYGFKRYIGTEKGRFVWDTFMLKIMRNLVLTLETSRFCRTLGTLLKSGVPLLTALRNVKDVIGNAVMRRSIDSVIKGAKEGQGISAPIIATGMFPPLALSMMKVGEETGQLEKMLLKIADTYDKTLRTTIKRVIAIIEPAMILIMGVIVAFIVMSMLLAVFSINEIPM